MLVYLTEEQAAEYFAVEPGDDDGDGEDTLPEQPQKPGDQTGDGDTTGGEQPPQEPVQPSEGREQITRIMGIRMVTGMTQQILRHKPRTIPQTLRQTRHSSHRNPLTAIVATIPLQLTTGRHSVLHGPW